MHPRRWYWMIGALDSSNRPYVVPAANYPMNAYGVQSEAVAEGIVGTWHGVPVILDANMPTTLGGGTEDAVIGARMADVLLFEGSLRTRALPEVLSAPSPSGSRCTLISRSSPAASPRPSARSPAPAWPPPPATSRT